MGKWSIINLSGLLSLCSISIAGPICDTGDIVSIEAKKFQYREQQENIKSILNEMTNWEVQPSALSDSILDGESRARKVQIRKGLYGVVKVDEGGLSVGGSASKETLAYRMDRIYGFDLVEPTVRKRLGIGQKQTYASVQLWIEDAVPLTKYKGNRIDLAEERDRLKLFDVMTLHADRIDDRNLMIKKSKLGDKLVAIDHEKAFLDFRTYISEIKEGELESVVHYLSTQRTQNTMLWQNIRDQLEHPQLLCLQFNSYLSKSNANQLMRHQQALRLLADPVFGTSCYSRPHGCENILIEFHAGKPITDVSEGLKKALLAIKGC